VEEATDLPHDPAHVYDLTDEEAYLQTDEDEKPAIVAEPMPDLLAARVCSFCKKAAEHLFGGVPLLVEKRADAGSRSRHVTRQG
jgi:hypothetical protein